MKTDFLIVGSGVAGLSLGIKLAEYYPKKQIVICTKADEKDSNTRYAQGGIAVVLDEEDSYQKHIDDTMRCGHYLCDPKIVELVVREAPHRLQDLQKWGFLADRNEQGMIDLGREGGHRENRIVHHQDKTGLEIENTLITEVLNHSNIVVHSHCFVVDLLVKNEVCYGVSVLTNDDKLELIYASYTILATGGIGQVYGHTTNPSIATGDGIAMASRVGAKIKGMEFIQFHPTALFSKKNNMTFLVSEAVRGFGAVLRNDLGERFMEKYDERKDLAPRDVVSESIVHELSLSGKECVWLDCRHLDMKKFIQHFPTIYETCLKEGIDVSEEMIPVAPAQHYLCGGIDVNRNGETSISHLFACGECAHTGLHGANRLASNSLLEAMVFSEQIYRHITTNFQEIPNDEFAFETVSTNIVSCELLVKTKLELQILMQKYAGIIRNKEDMTYALNQLKEWNNWAHDLLMKCGYSKDLMELQNMLEVSVLILEQSLVRDQSIGTFQLNEVTLHPDNRHPQHH